VPRHKHQDGRLSVFKGREAKLNRAIFQILAHKGPMTIYEVSKEVSALRGLKHTKYTNVNRRMRVLEQARFLKKAGMRKTRAGFESTLYELTARGFASTAFNQTDMNEFIENADDEQVLELLAILVSFLRS
jgi:DNA-binding PadR family transcriptional regulator